MTEDQIDILVDAFIAGERLAWNARDARGFRRITLIHKHYVDPEDLEPIPTCAAFLEKGGYIDLHNTDPADILVIEVSNFF